MTADRSRTKMTRTLRKAGLREVHSRFERAVGQIEMQRSRRRSIDTALDKLGMTPRASAVDFSFTPPAFPKQFGDSCSYRTERSARIVKAAIAHLHSEGIKPSRRTIVAASKLPEVDSEGLGVSLAVLERGEARRLYLEATRDWRRSAAQMSEVPSWAARLDRSALERLTVDAEKAARQSLSETMREAERLLQARVTEVRDAAIEIMKARLDRAP
jgi:hypothetical protein